MTRYVAVILSGILAALGGAYLSIGFVGSFGENMTAGRGFIALAAVIFGNWRPFGAYAAAVLFGASTALSFRLAVVLRLRSRALPGAPVRPDAHRRRRRDRPFDPARIRWPPLREAVTTAPSARGAPRPRGGGLPSPAAVVVSRQTRGVHLLDAAWAIPRRGGRSASAALLFARGAARPRRAGRSSTPAASARIRARPDPRVAGICFALSASIAVGFYELLLRLEGCSAGPLYNRAAVFEIGNSLREARVRQGSTTHRSSSRRRSARSTSARSRTSSSRSCPRARTSRASSAPTRSSSGSTASSTSTSTTRATSSTASTSMPQRRAARPPGAVGRAQGRRRSRSPASPR